MNLTKFAVLTPRGDSFDQRLRAAASIKGTPLDVAMPFTGSHGQVPRRWL